MNVSVNRPAARLALARPAVQTRRRVEERTGTQAEEIRHTLQRLHYERANGYFTQVAGVIQLVECQLPKLDVAGSSPVARSG